MWGELPRPAELDAAPAPASCPRPSWRGWGRARNRPARQEQSAWASVGGSLCQPRRPSTGGSFWRFHRDWQVCLNVFHSQPWGRARNSQLWSVHAVGVEWRRKNTNRWGRSNARQSSSAIAWLRSLTSARAAARKSSARLERSKTASFQSCGYQR